MKALLDKLFTRENAVRFLIILGCTLFCVAWMYVFVALVSNDWGFLTANAEPAKDSGEILTLIMGISALIFMFAVVGTLVYLNGKFWMVDHLGRSWHAFLGIFGFIPVVRELNRPEDAVDELVIEGDGTTYVIPDGLPMIVALPLGILLTLIKSLAKTAFWLVTAIGIPVLSPIIVSIGAAGLSYLFDLQGVLTTIGTVLAALVSLFLLIGVPIIGFKRG